LRFPDCITNQFQITFAQIYWLYQCEKYTEFYNDEFLQEVKYIKYKKNGPEYDRDGEFTEIIWGGSDSCQVGHCKKKVSGFPVPQPGCH
jgi:hypothetical protein